MMQAFYTHFSRPDVSKMELIAEDAPLTEAPSLKDGFCLIAAYDPGFGLPPALTICRTGDDVRDLNDRHAQGQILNLKWYQGPYYGAVITLH